MRLIRIYINQKFEINQTFTVDQQPFNHLIKVLRLNVNDSFIVFNGDGYNYHAIIIDIQKKQLTAKTSELSNPENESPLDITLYQAISKSDHMDWTIQKAVELGANSIVPFYSQRTQGRFKNKQLEKKQKHWEQIAISACEQSGRSLLCNTLDIIDFNSVLIKLTNAKNKYVFDFDKKAIKFNQLPTKLNEINIICGPEGGFIPEEITAFKDIATKVVTLGPRVLRTETAAISAISVLQYKYGDI